MELFLPQTPSKSLVSKVVLQGQACSWKPAAALLEGADLICVEGQNPFLAALSVEVSYLIEVNGEFP